MKTVDGVPGLTGTTVVRDEEGALAAVTADFSVEEPHTLNADRNK